MGAAKRRGTFEQRKELAVEANRLRQEKWEAARRLERIASKRARSDREAMGLYPDDEHRKTTPRRRSPSGRAVGRLMLGTALYSALSTSMFRI